MSDPLAAALESEQALLGALLINPKAYLAVQPFLEPSHFCDPVHGAIFTSLSRAVENGETPTVLTLRDALPADLTLGDVTPLQYLSSLAAGTYTPGASVSTVLSVARGVHAWSLRRSLSSVADDVKAIANDSSFEMTVRDQIADVEKRLIELSEIAGRADPQSLRKAQGYEEVLEEIEARSKSGNYLNGASTGLIDLDNRLGGLAPGQLVIIAARPSVGKTLVGVSLARAAARAGTGVAFDSIEQPEGQIRLRLLSDEAYVDGVSIAYSRAGKGQLDGNQLSALTRAGGRLNRLPLVVIDHGNRLADIPSHIRLARRQLERFGKPLQIFIIDYLGLLSPGDRYKGQKVNEVGEISATLKALAKREGLCIIALHQLSRANESRPDKRPILSDLRDSGSIEQDADVVMFVHRESYYLDRISPNERTPEQTAAVIDKKYDLELIVAKQRQGPIGVEHMWADVSLNALRCAGNDRSY